MTDSGMTWIARCIGALFAAFLSTLHIEAGVAMAAVFGSLCMPIMLKDRPMRVMLAEIFVSFFVGVFGSMFFVAFAPGLQAPGAFVCGLFGPVIVLAIRKKIEEGDLLWWKK